MPAPDPASCFVFTEARVRALPEPASGERMRYRDGSLPGLVLRVTPGARVFAWRSRPEGQTVEVTLGRWPGLTVEAAREKARQVAVDPSAAARRKRERLAEASVRDAWSAHLRDRTSTLRPATLVSYEEAWKSIEAAIGSKRVSDVTPTDIARMRDRAARDHGASHARRVVAVASLLFNALARDPATRLAHVPTRGVARPRVEPRRRFLDSSELGAVLRGLEAEPKLWRVFWLCCLLAPLRRGNIAAAKWSDLLLDGKAPRWLVPASEAKGKRLLAMPIVEPLARVLADWREDNRNEDYVFPAGLTGGPRAGTNHIVSVAHSWQRVLRHASAVRLCDAIAAAEKVSARDVIDAFHAEVEAERLTGMQRHGPREGTPLERALGRLRERAKRLQIDADSCELKDAKPHDLRRTAASWAVQGGASLAVVAASLGHADSRVAEAHYAHLTDSPVRGMLDANAVRLLSSKEEV